ncbi:uncharacterized protein LOC120073479 [Benincasa hispida]|uniref:uncharacterized protein LOC120073479 n=1 Tax=Benincasa hispida TaxID=102211 RepID=UPI0019010642|nr:uncharacterized protein LOC120073479 [Benincasa hispida]
MANATIIELKATTEPLKFSTPPLNQLLNQITSIKLERGTFMLWKTLSLPILKGYRLEGHLSRTKVCPLMFILSTSSVAKPGEVDSQASEGALSSTYMKSLNPQYEAWVTANQLLLGWLYNSMTREVVVQLMGYKSAKSLWDAIHLLFGVQSRA